MDHYTKIALILSICLTICFIADTVAQVETETPTADYIFETIESSRCRFSGSECKQRLRGIMRGTPGAPMVKKSSALPSLTVSLRPMISPGSQNTYFYALGNNGEAAGHYKDSNGLYHGCYHRRW